MATPAIIREGTTKLSPQGGLGSLVVGLAQKDGMMVPRIFPREVCAFQIPIINPRLHTSTDNVIEHTAPHTAVIYKEEITAIVTLWQINHTILQCYVPSITILGQHARIIPAVYIVQ